MPGLSEMMHLSRLSPEIPRMDMLEQEEEPGSQANTLFDMFGASHLPATTTAASAAAPGSLNSGSSHDRPVFYAAELNSLKAATSSEREHQQPAEHGFDSFGFFTRSLFEEKEKEQLIVLEERRPSGIEAPVAKLWTTEFESEPHHFGDTSYEHHGSSGSLMPNSSWGAGHSTSSAGAVEAPTTTTTTANKPKRKRSRPCKSSEEVESQRMTHIAVERNRRKQMNEHLRVLRSLMPGSYVHRGDQASIIGGAIEFVKELQQLLQVLEEQKKRKMVFAESSPGRLLAASTLIQQPTSAASVFRYRTTSPPAEAKYFSNNECEPMLREFHGFFKSELADVEVKIVDLTTGFIKILCQRKSGQLLKTMIAIENKLFFSIMHTNVTTIEQTVLYSFEVKIGPECTQTADDIAAFIHHTLVWNHNDLLQD